MKREQFKKETIGELVRLRPPAQGPGGEELDEDWRVVELRDEAVQLVNEGRGTEALLGLEHIFNYFSYPARTANAQRSGFLQLHSQVRIGADGRVTVEPLFQPVAAAARRAVPEPLVVRVANETRYFSWRGRGTDALHLVEREEAPRQLFDDYGDVCDALRQDSGREPELCPPNDLRGEIVYELSSDGQARRHLFAKPAGQSGRAILVLTDRPAAAARRNDAIRAASRRLAELREHGAEQLLNRAVSSLAEHDMLDIERHQWLDEVATVMKKAGCTLPEITEVRRPQAYTPKGLPALVTRESLRDADRSSLVTRNVTHRNEMAERLDRLARILKRLDS